MHIFFLILFLHVQLQSNSKTYIPFDNCTNPENKNLIGKLYCLPDSDDIVYLDVNDENISSVFFSIDYAYDVNPYKMNERYEKIFTELAYLQVYAVATIGVLSVLPTSFTHWEEDDKSKDFLQIHSDHIDQGPVTDSDDWAVNYIGHSVSGSYYYVWGRQAGLDWQESFLLTALMSTMYWEYGWEAFAETPSTQDLIITPLLGSLLGEGTNYLYNEVRANNDTVYGSKILGSLARALLNPIGELNQYCNRFVDDSNIKLSVDYSYNQNSNNFLPNTYNDNNYYLNNASFGIKFNFNY